VTLMVTVESGVAMPDTTSMSLGLYVALSGDAVIGAASASGLNITTPITNKTTVFANLMHITFLLSLTLFLLLLEDCVKLYSLLCQQD
jgi:hypothetical protein